MSQDFYDLLGVPRSATKEQIRHAYLGLARKYHPDTNQGIETDEQLKEVNHAYEILSDDESRTGYNLALLENDPSEFTTKLYSFKSVALACAVTTVLGTTLGYGLTFIQPKPDPVVVMVPSPAATPPDRAGIEKTLEKLDTIKDIPSLQNSSVAPLKKKKIPTPASIKDKKQPVGFEPKNFVYSATTKLSVLNGFPLTPDKRANQVASRKPSLATKAGRASLDDVASKPEPRESPALQVGSSPEAILSTIQISMEDGSLVSADTLLRLDPHVWRWNGGRYRKKLAKFISALIESRDIALASEQSGLSLGEIRYLVKHV